MKISKAAAEKFEISVRLAKSYLKDGKISINGNIIKKDKEYTDGELALSVETERPKVDPSQYIVREFDHIVYFDKPAFMHSERHKPDDPLTMQDVLEAYSKDFEFITRLDYMTDGVITAVQKGFFVFETKKEYLAYVEGEFAETVEINKLIDVSRKNKVVVTEEEGGYKTVLTPVEYKDGFTLVKCEFEKGVRHQLRAYLSYLGNPIVGDPLYGSGEYYRVMLHCKATYANRFPGISKLTEDFINSMHFLE
jgi:23S rRNA-/tRNA-specific pseudouridylate synthase